METLGHGELREYHGIIMEISWFQWWMMVHWIGKIGKRKTGNSGNPEGFFCNWSHWWFL
jgi:hypothetical protein